MKKWFIAFALILCAGVTRAASPSFLYDGKPADLGAFSAETLDESATEAFASKTTAYTAPDGKLRLTIVEKKYTRFPVEEYSIRLENLSQTEPTALVENFKSLDAAFALPEKEKAVTLNGLCGSTCVPSDFTPLEFPLPVGEKKEFRTPSGRSSNDYLPFIEANYSQQRGTMIAVGWTGAWAADFSNDGANLRVVAGMDQTRFRLHPGESIRQPSIAIFQRDGQARREFKTLVHRFMIDEKSPRDAQGNLQPPIFALTAGGGNKTPQMMLDILKYATDHKLPFNTYWIDAGWYGAPHEDDHYPNCGPLWGIYVGDWRVNTTTHPTGDLLPIANAVHEAGLKFLLWFEPERMTDSAPILAEHPDYRSGQLVDYGNPAALAWIQETIYGIIAKHKIDIYRQDFNMEPGPVWREKDAANAERVGMAEARHITGLYQFLDQMRERFPNIQQENCASGGRRLDWEMISRAYPYCRSDYPIGQKPGDTALVFSQNATLNMVPYVPFQGSETNCAPVFDDYAMVSCYATGAVFTPTDLDGGIVKRAFTPEETAWFQKTLAVGRRMCDLSFGDFYPLTEETTAANDLWCGWQLHDADKKCGYAVVFRRADAPDAEQTFSLGGIDSAATYEIEDYNDVKSTVSGAELAAWKVTLEPRSFALIFYTQK